MFNNVWEELLMLRFVSKNMKHQRKVSEQMVKNQEEALRLQRGENIRTTEPKALTKNNTSNENNDKFDLAEELKSFRPLQKDGISKPKEKHIWLSILLTLTLGPLGLFYTTQKYAIAMTIIFVLAVILRIDSLIVWGLINATIVAIGILKSMEQNEDLIAANKQ